MILVFIDVNYNLRGNRRAYDFTQAKCETQKSKYNMRRIKIHFIEYDPRLLRVVCWENIC